MLIFSSDLFFIDSVKLTKNLIGLSIYLFKKSEKIKITRAIAITVLIIKFFLSFTAINISFASSDTLIKPTKLLSISTLLYVFTKKFFFIIFSITNGPPATLSI